MGDVWDKWAEMTERQSDAAHIADLEAKLTWAMGLNACVEHARAERAEAERDALRDRVRELEQGNLEEGPFGWGMREGGEK